MDTTVDAQPAEHPPLPPRPPAPLLTWHRQPMTNPKARYRLIDLGVESPFFVDRERYPADHTRPYGVYGSGMHPSGCAATLGHWGRLDEAKKDAETRHQHRHRLTINLHPDDGAPQPKIFAGRTRAEALHNALDWLKYVAEADWDDDGSGPEELRELYSTPVGVVLADGSGLELYFKDASEDFDDPDYQSMPLRWVVAHGHPEQAADMVLSWEFDAGEAQATLRALEAFVGRLAVDGPHWS